MATWLELVLLFVLLPLGFLLSPFPIPKIPALLLVTLLCLKLLLSDGRFAREGLWDRQMVRAYLKTLLWRVILAGAGLLLFTLLFSQETLFDFPRSRPGFWVMVMVLYPLFSAYPQELVYRAFFFHRYRLLFRTPRQMIWASSLAFAFLHIIFQNPIGVILTIPGGYLLSLTYQRTNSLVLTGIEHALYGNLVFTVGLGLYFYRGPY
jgi:membrane protease YdiL (CAAX protease family)